MNAPNLENEPMEIRNTVLLPSSLYVLSRGEALGFATLCSAARSEYLPSRRFDGHFMKKFTSLMQEAAPAAYAGGAFAWSRYNLRQWEKFVACDAASPEGGSCVFSFEPDGDYREQAHATFKALFLGVPTGMYPYHVSVRHDLAKLDTAALHAWITARGYVTA